MAASFEKVRDQALREAERGGKDQSRLLRNLDSRQRKALTLFRQSREIAARDVAELFGLKPRSAALLCQRWVENGFLETTDPARKSRRYKLSEPYDAIVDEVDDYFPRTSASGISISPARRIPSITSSMCPGVATQPVRATGSIIQHRGTPIAK